MRIPRQVECDGRFLGGCLGQSSDISSFERRPQRASCHADELIGRESRRADWLMKMLFLAVTLTAARQRTIVSSGRMSQAADREIDDFMTVPHSHPA
jgi:hypothetical protein